MNVKEMFDLSGKVALITGGGRGIGKAVAEAYGDSGAKIVISGRRDEWLAPTLAEFKEKGYDCISVVADVSKPEDVENTVKLALEKYGQINILVNNAGQTWGQPTEELSLAKWQQLFDVNLTGIFMMSQQVGRHMIERKQGGRIINVASIAGLSAGDPESTKTIAYNTSKAGVIAFTRTLAKEWGRYNIHVNAIAPGWFPTRMASGVINANKAKIEATTPLGRVGDLEELKGAAIFLASPASSYVTGHTMVVDGGLVL